MSGSSLLSDTPIAKRTVSGLMALGIIKPFKTVHIGKDYRKRSLQNILSGYYAVYPVIHDITVQKDVRLYAGYLRSVPDCRQRHGCCRNGYLQIYRPIWCKSLFYKASKSHQKTYPDFRSAALTNYSPPKNWQWLNYRIFDTYFLNNKNLLHSFNSSIEIVLSSHEKGLPHLRQPFI